MSLSMEDAPKRKRRRPALSCYECRRRKIRCDRHQPCRQCTQSNVPECVFSSDAPSSLIDRSNLSQITSFAVQDVSAGTNSTTSNSSATTLGASPAQTISTWASFSIQSWRLSWLGTSGGKVAFQAYTVFSSDGGYADAGIASRTIGPVISNDLAKLCQQPVHVGASSAEALQHSDGCLTNGDSTERPSHQTPASRGPGSLDKQRQLLARELIPVDSSVPELQGVLSKTRLYGPAHYKSSFEQVRTPRNAIVGFSTRLIVEVW